MTTAYRCTACGNRTRFDVLEQRRARSFVHFALDGTSAVEEQEVLSLVTESVTCRWCGSSRSIEEIDLDAEGGAGSLAVAGSAGPEDPRSGSGPR